MARERKSKSMKQTEPRIKRGKVAEETPAGIEPCEDHRDDDLFPIVGIGASAGGLEAVEQFLRPVPDDCGIAFVIVQHLDPTRKGMMAELLQRITSMKVVQITDLMKVERNCVYVIPPNKDLSILHGVLHLLTPTAPRGRQLPIDFFFRSLAADRHSRSIGVILSGMGSDGTLGLRAVKEQGGAVFVQEPASAKFDAMPKSVIDAGLADVTAPAEVLAERVVAFCGRSPGVDTPRFVLAPKAQSSIDKICVLLRNRTGHDFSQYKRSTVYRRIERRMGLHQIDDIAGYVRYLQESEQETMLLFKELLIGVTSFFRDPDAWEYLIKQAIPNLLSERASEAGIRAWVPGCSTGEEAYSLAIALIEAEKQLHPDREISLQVFATDLDKDAIERARRGLYPLNIESDVPSELLARYFIREEHGYRVSRTIREMVVFATQNLIMDPPFTKLDILSCRNLLIYLNPELQHKLLPLFYYSLNPSGILFLGNAESTGASAGLFDQKDGVKMRVYRRLSGPSRIVSVDFPSSFRDRTSGFEHRTSASNLQTSAERFLLERYSPAAVFTNEQGDILYVSGHTGKYLEPAAGKADWNIHAMARDELRYELCAAFRRALQEKSAIEKVRIKGDHGGCLQDMEIVIEPLTTPPALSGMVMITFRDIIVSPTEDKPLNKVRRRPSAVAELERALKGTREQMHTAREEMQTSQEELKSSNEELQSANEELQSTNEELTTSKEEMQSMNEELQTLNLELQTKLDELSHTNDDMRNLLDASEIAMLFLDISLKVRRYTAQMTNIINLIPTDIDRPITDLTSNLIYPGLAEDAREVLKSLVFKETRVSTVEGRRYSVRIKPYRTVDNRIDGVVITFTDISAVD